jgi:hypothetical protein
MTLDAASIRDWLEQSCARQGVPVVVTDHTVVARVGVLLGGGGAARTPAERASTARHHSEAPDGDDSGRIEPAEAKTR